MKKLTLIFLAFLLVSMQGNLLAEVDYTKLVEIEANYILQCQFTEQADPAYGCINNIFGRPTWVVPRENALAILGLIMAYDILGSSVYLERAELAADYLVRVQDAEGAWFNQYNYITPGDPLNPGNREALAKSPTQAAEVMIAFYRLGCNSRRYVSMKKAAEYLIACQKNGGNGYLLGGGKDAEGVFRTERWASDNSFAYQALKAAEIWAISKRDFQFARVCSVAAKRIITGINSVLYIRNPKNPDYGVWHRVVNERNRPVDPSYHDWINYAPQMLGLPAKGVDQQRVGRWIHNTLQKSDGACVWDNASFDSRKSPGFSFQASLCWRDLNQAQYYNIALGWALNSSLWQISADGNGVTGGWIDWVENGNSAGWWERFIDTSFYAIAAYNGGYDFAVLPSNMQIVYEP